MPKTKPSPSVGALSRKAKFAAVMAATRAEAGFATPAALSDRLKVSRPTVLRWESTDAKHGAMPSLGQLDKYLSLLSPDARLKVLQAFFAGYPRVAEYLGIPEEPEIDDTPPELRAILERVRRQAIENKETRDFLTMTGRIGFRPCEPTADHHPQAKKRIRTLMLLFAKFLRVCPGLTTIEYQAVDAVVERNERG